MTDWHGSSRTPIGAGPVPASPSVDGPGPTPARRRKWRAPRTVTLIAVAAALVVFAACGALLYYAAASVDRITEARETQLVQRNLLRRLSRMNDEVASVAIWSDAYDFTARKLDPAWAHINFGVYFHDYLHHDLTLLTDGEGRVTYTSADGEVTQPEQLAAFQKAARPLLDVVRAEEAARTRRSPSALGFDRVAAAQAAVRVGDAVYLVGASTIVPEPEYARSLLPGRSPVVMSAVRIGPEYLAELDRDLGLTASRLAPGATAERPAVRLMSAGGAPVAAIVWTAERPGAGVYRDAWVSILVVGAIVVGIVTLLIAWLARVAATVERARRRAEAGDRAKSEFIANVSHEIRTPLNGVLGMAQVMAAHELSDAQKQRLSVVRESGSVLLRLLDDLLDAAKIEAGKLQLETGVFDVETLVQEVAATFAGVAEGKGLRLETSVAADAAGAWQGDALRLRQVLSNLVSNAVKFTDAGTVALRVSLSEGLLCFRVTDTGIGVSAERLPDLFQKFSQIDASTTRRFGGTGLGLAIVHSLVGMMGGAVTVESRPREGSCFTVRLPLARSAAPVGVPYAPVAEPGPARELRILAAEDNATNRMVLKAMLEPLGVEIEMVANGREAVSAFAAAHFDLVLMDIQMPEMNGLDATQEIRAFEAREGRVRTPVLALTANVMAHQLETYAEAGMDGHVGKPIEISRLYAALEEALAPPAGDLAA